MPLLVLIDGHSHLHKAYHAIKEPLTNAAGEPTGAVFGFLNFFLRLRKQLQFEHVAVVFDPPVASFRSAMFEDYKANREAPPSDLLIGERLIREMLGLMGIPVREIYGMEADDVLGSLAVEAVKAGGEALVCSVDKDLLQVVRPGIKVLREHLDKSQLMDDAAVFERLGVKPAQVPTYLGLVGDSSDNIPGVPGVGPKTAALLIQEFDTLEAILAAAPSMKKKALSANLQQHAEDARLSEKLATLDLACAEPVVWDDFLYVPKTTPELIEFFRRMNFQSMLAELGAPAAPAPTIRERTTDYRTIRTIAELDTALAALRIAGIASIDTETTGLDPFEADLVGISLSWELNGAVYIPLGHREEGVQLAVEAVRERLAPMLRDPAIQWVAHNWNYDYKILRRAGFDPGPVSFDTLIAAYLVQPDRPNSLRLKELALSLLGFRMTEISELIGEGDMLTMAIASVEDSTRYACQDADATLQLYHHFAPLIEKNELGKLLREVELPLTVVLAEMETEGVNIDRPHFKKLSAEAEKTLQKLTGEAHQIAGRAFNLNSPKQVAELLFEELKLPSQKKGKSGTPSTDVSVLESLADMHPLPNKLLEFRQVEKLKSTYMDPLPSMVHFKTGRVHTSFNQAVAATGRLSSSSPNLQNIPVRTEAGRLIRRGFIPRAAGWKLLAADYSQIELRILAHLSGDDALCEAFRSGGDIHALTASKMFHLELADVTSTQRGQAKAINFGIIYGMSDFRLSNDLGIPRAEAKRFIEDYFRVYAGVGRFIEETKEGARRNGFVTTMLGRRRLLPDINARNGNDRQQAERIAVNTPIQGTSADMIKLAMLRVSERIAREKLRARMILQVHDELIFDAPVEELVALEALVREEMAGALPLAVPVKVDVAVGVNWEEV